MPSLSRSFKERCLAGPGPGGSMPAPAGTDTGTGGGGARAGDDITMKHVARALTLRLQHHTTALLTRAATKQKQPKPHK